MNVSNSLLMRISALLAFLANTNTLLKTQHFKVFKRKRNLKKRGKSFGSSSLMKASRWKSKILYNLHPLSINLKSLKYLNSK